MLIAGLTLTAPGSWPGRPPASIPHPARRSPSPGSSSPDPLRLLGLHLLLHHVRPPRCRPTPTSTRSSPSSWAAGPRRNAGLEDGPRHAVILGGVAVVKPPGCGLGSRTPPSPPALLNSRRGIWRPPQGSLMRGPALGYIPAQTSAGTTRELSIRTPPGPGVQWRSGMDRDSPALILPATGTFPCHGAGRRRVPRFWSPASTALQGRCGARRPRHPPKPQNSEFDIPGRSPRQVQGARGQAGADKVRADLGAQKVREFKSHAEHWKLPPGQEHEDAVARLRRNPHVEYAEPNYILHATLVPNDQGYSALWVCTTPARREAFPEPTSRPRPPGASAPAIAPLWSASSTAASTTRIPIWRPTSGPIR